MQRKVFFVYTANIFAPISGAKTSVTIYNLRFPSHVPEKAPRMVLPCPKYEKGFAIQYSILYQPQLKLLPSAIFMPSLLAENCVKLRWKYLPFQVKQNSPCSDNKLFSAIAGRACYFSKFLLARLNFQL